MHLTYEKRVSLVKWEAFIKNAYTVQSTYDDANKTGKLSL